MRAPYANLWQRLTRVLPLLLAALGCGEQETIAPSEPGTAIVKPQLLAANAPFNLRGAIITPNGVIKRGYVGVTNGRIAAVSDKQPDIPGATVINTDGIMLPGFVDVHNHVPWNALPRWHPTQTYANRYQWQVDPATCRPRDNLLIMSPPRTSVR